MLHKNESDLLYTICASTAAIIIAASLLYGCKPRRSSSGLQGTPEEILAQYTEDLFRIKILDVQAKSEGWAKVYLDPEKLKAASLASTLQQAKPTPEEGSGWPLAKQINGIIGLSDQGRQQLQEIPRITNKWYGDPDKRMVPRQAVYFLSWLLHEMGVQYEADAVDENLRTYFTGCKSFTECAKLLQDVSMFGDMSPGSTIRNLVGDDMLKPYYGGAIPASARQLFNMPMWYDMLLKGFPTKEKVTPDSLYGQIFALETAELRQLLVFHLHTLFLSTMYYGIIGDYDVQSDATRRAFVRQPSGRIPSMPDEWKALVQNRISELKDLHATIIAGPKPPEALAGVAGGAGVAANELGMDERFVQRLKDEISVSCSDDFHKMAPAQTEGTPTGPVDYVEVAAQELRTGFIRALEGVYALELYLGRLNKREIRPWLDAVASAKTEVAVLTLARNMKREAVLPSALSYARTLAYVVKSSPRLIVTDQAGQPRQTIRPDYQGVNKTFDDLTFLNRTMMFGTYSLEPFDAVEKARDQRGGFLGSLINGTARKMSKEEKVNGCTEMSSGDIREMFFLNVGQQYEKLSVNPNAPENADPEDPFVKTVRNYEIPRLMAYQQDLANRFPQFHSMIYRSNLYTKSALNFGFFQDQISKSEQEKQRVKDEQSTVRWIWNGVEDFVLHAVDGATVIVSLAGYTFFGLFAQDDQAFDEYVGKFYDPNFRGDYKYLQSGLEQKSQSSMKEYLHQFLLFNCYNYMTVSDATFRKDPAVCGPNGKPYKLSKVCFDDRKGSAAEQWARRWDVTQQPPFVETNILRFVADMEEKDFAYQKATLIANTIVQIPFMMLSGYLGGLAVGRITGTVASRFLTPAITWSAAFTRAGMAHATGALLNATVNMASFAVVHKAMTLAWNMAYARIAGGIIGVDRDAEYRRAVLQFYDSDKTFFENYGEELAGGSFLFFIQPSIGRLTDKLFGKLLRIRSTEHFKNLGEGTVGIAKYWERARKVMFIAGTGTTDGIFFFTMPFLEARVFSWLEGHDPQDKLKMIGNDFAKEFGNSFATALAFRVHGNLGGHFSNGPNAQRVDLAKLKYVESLARYREAYDKAVAVPLANGTSAEPAYVQALNAERVRMTREEADLKRVLEKFLEKRYRETRKPETPPLDMPQAVREAMQDLANSGDFKNPLLGAPKEAAPGAGRPPELPSGGDDR